jgi:hypothetical protein
VCFMCTMMPSFYHMVCFVFVGHYVESGAAVAANRISSHQQSCLVRDVCIHDHGLSFRAVPRVKFYVIH